MNRGGRQRFRWRGRGFGRASGQRFGHKPPFTHYQRFQASNIPEVASYFDWSSSDSESDEDIKQVDEVFQTPFREPAECSDYFLDCNNDVTNSAYWPISEKLSKVIVTSSLPSHLECEICLDILSDPVQTSCCGQGYCKNCIKQVKSKVCPHCRSKLEYYPDKKSLRIINDLQIKCPYHIEGKCQWKGSSSELKNHLKVCDIKPMTCSLGCGKQFEKKNMEVHMKYLCRLRKIPCKYCEKQVSSKDMSKHHEVCPKMLIPCPNKCFSTKEFTHEKMKEHIKVCPNQMVACKYTKFGCNEKEMKRRDYNQHLSLAMELHLHLVAEFAEKESKARKMLEGEMKEIVAAKKRLENRIAAVERRLAAL